MAYESDRRLQSGRHPHFPEVLGNREGAASMEEGFSERCFAVALSVALQPGPELAASGVIGACGEALLTDAAES